MILRLAILALALVSALFAYPVTAGGPLSPAALVRELAKVGFANGSVVPIGGSNYTIDNLQIETRKDNTYAVVFSATPK